MNARRTGLAALCALASTTVLGSCTAASTSASGQASCHPPSPITTSSLGPEVRGTGHGASLYGNLQLTKSLPMRADEQVKIVWRMTGSGPLHLTVTGPHNKSVPLQWGPEIHGSSNYERPGQEWGAGFLFPTSGCWHVRAQRSNASADVWFRVAGK